MEPAKTIVAILGGPKKVGDYVGLSVGGITRWYTPLKRGGCGGLVPSRHIPALCRLAKKQGKFMEPNMFFEGHMEEPGFE